MVTAIMDLDATSLMVKKSLLKVTELQRCKPDLMITTRLRIAVNSIKKEFVFMAKDAFLDMNTRNFLRFTDTTTLLFYLRSDIPILKP